MPILPRGLGRDLVERVKSRLRQEVGPSEPPEAPGDEARPGLDFLERVTNRLRRDQGEQRGPARRPPPSGPSEVMARIQEAGRNRVFLLAYYAAGHGNGPSWRYLLPYSYRYRDKDDPGLPLLFARCAIHHEPGSKGVEAFKMRRFRDAQVTSLTFADPAWSVEF